QAEWISSKIGESTRLLQENQRTSVKHDDYKLTLLYRQSRDGNTTAKFRELCNNKGPTIAVGKVLGTEEILGGYNPFAWGVNHKWLHTKENFIFSLDKSRDKNIVSFFANKNTYSIYDGNNYFPYFGDGGDLSFGYYSDNSYIKPYATNYSYQVPIRHSSDKFEWADWEVFLVSKL